MITKKQIAVRGLIGGLAGLGAALAVTLLLNLFLRGLSWGGPAGAGSLQLTSDRAAAYFGSGALAVLVEMLVVFVFGACVGLTTLPFSETWTNLPGVSLLHFVLTGVLVQLLGWSYQWLGLEHGPLILLVLYAGVYLAVWLVRYLRWSVEVRQLRRALGLEEKEELK